MGVILLILIVGAGIACLAYTRLNGISYIGRTQAGLTIVHDDTYVLGERIRVLEVDGTYQSATFLDERWANLVFPYHSAFDHLFDDWPDGGQPQSVAVLGGGGYAVPKHLVAHHPELTLVEVVEIDPAIERIGRKFFFLDRLERHYGAERAGRLRLHVADARSWLEAQTTRYDAIINDCFFGIQPEGALVSEDASQLIASRLTSEGVYLTNVVSALEGPDSAILDATIGALSKSFSYLWIYPFGSDEPEGRDNNVVIASNMPRNLVGAWRWPPNAKERP